MLGKIFKFIKGILIVLGVLFVIIMLIPLDDESETAVAETAAETVTEMKGEAAAGTIAGMTGVQADAAASGESAAGPDYSGSATAQMSPEEALALITHNYQHGSSASGGAGGGGSQAGNEAAAQGGSAAAQSYTWQGNPAYDFSAVTLQGEKFRLSEQAGKVVLLNLWATWCPPCVGEMPALQKLYEEYGTDGDVRIVLVNCGESKSTVQKFMSDNGYSMTMICDTDESISERFDVQSIPRTIVFDKNGKVQDDFAGAYGADQQYIEDKKLIEALR
ncbi:MAG: TlpA disulfide reductase family protein [Eubacteriales bacterium]|nr:TlpA disulfide reductase family protein [Eubacteriales bacterium]